MRSACAALDHYRYRLFRVEHGIDPYPLRIASGRAAADVAEAHDEEGLYDALERIFGASATLSVVRTLRSLSRD
jgi:hypothetical protein